MKVFLITEDDLTKLINDNEFVSLKAKGEFKESEDIVREVHRKFHYNIVNWSQEIQKREKL